LFAESQILLVTMGIDNKVVYEAVRIADENDMFVILDPAPAPDSIPEDIPEMVDIFTPNESEAEIITGINIDTKEDALMALKELKKMGFPYPIITWGKNGSLIYNNDEYELVNSLENLNVVDSTAAAEHKVVFAVSTLSNPFFVSM